ncbi:proline--tRNA ligase [candidate division WWE3 bacterium CG_4_9_14_0_2_um_filter_48_10]|uniref:Proline--tRNA ligase n=1 Tax=candidate division WWE3 bacterium CG_4_9_14_0_2_um_filter_48_10 TaxID=1975078 RepID=A0A2M8EJ47_UNCKA|nr:MAG: proline--tRNA ligase [candidate division WWE3 bacterium CG_4_9_14_0_2_um_filter_48_10]
MRYSQLFGKTLREVPKAAEAASHKFLIKAGYIDQLLAGVYTLLPLGWRVHRKIEEIIREEMEAIGAQEILMPALQKKEQWVETGRWSGKGEIDPPLFKFKDRRGREFALGPTHEEVVTDLARRFISSYKDLPLAVFHIQDKFRNELRPTGGLLRVREFMMKDLYSFHANEADLDRYYLKVIKAYERIFARCGLQVLVVGALSGTIGGSESHEFMLPSKTGEDTTIYCEHCHFAANKNKVGELKGCPQCRQAVFTTAAIELGHVFKLGTLYSEKMKAYFTDRSGTRKPLVMGCYGIGLGRIMAAVVEVSYDKKGIIWPKTLTPFDVHLVALEGGEEVAEQIYEAAEKSGLEMLFDDRDESAGVKLADADLIGVPVRVVVSAKSLKAGGVEVCRRIDGKAEVVPADKLAEKIKEIYSQETGVSSQ